MKKSLTWAEKLSESYHLGNLEEYQNELYLNQSKMTPQTFHQNIALYYFQKGDYSLCRYHVEKAMKLGPKTEQLEEIMQQVEKVLFHKSSEIPFELPGNFLYHIQQTDILIAFLMLTLGMLCYFAKWQLPKKRRVWPLWTYLLILFGSFGTIVYIHEITFSAVALKEVEIKSGPSAIFGTKGVIPSGQRLVIKKGDNDWAKVLYPKIYTGNIRQQDLGLMPKK